VLLFEISRQAAIQSLPLQSQALVAQASLAAAQGNTQTAQFNLQQAQDKVNQLFQIKAQDAQNQYNWKQNILDKVYEFATRQEQRLLDEKRLEQERDFEREMNDLDFEQQKELERIKQSSPLYQSQLRGQDLRNQQLEQELADGQDDPSMTNMIRAATTVVRDASDALYLLGDDEVLPSSEVVDLKPIWIQGSSPLAAGSRIASSKIPGTPEYELQNLIDSVKSNIGIDTLLNIKREGSGLGQVPQKQLETLQEVLGKLNIGRDLNLLRRDINDVVSQYEDIINKSGATAQGGGNLPSDPLGLGF
jgi:hypothetical protein